MTLGGVWRNDDLDSGRARPLWSRREFPADFVGLGGSGADLPYEDLGFGGFEDRPAPQTWSALAGLGTVMPYRFTEC